MDPAENQNAQYKALLKTEKVDLDFGKDSIEEIAKLSTEINSNVENIGARRLHTVLEKLVENISFNASENKGKKIKITSKQVKDEVGKLAKDIDLSKFIL